jgi:hypothetical protein
MRKIFFFGGGGGLVAGYYVGDSDGNINTSPYGSAISNPSVSPSAI